MTQGTDDNGKMLEKANAPVVKTGSAIPSMPLSEEVIEDLRSYVFNLIDTKKWAGRSIRDIASEIINADEKGTDQPRFYTTDNENKRKRFNFETTRRLLNTYRHRSLEAFKDDLMPYLQEAIVEVIKTAGKKPANLKLILDSLKLGQKEQENDNTGENTATPAYAKIRDRIRVGGAPPERKSAAAEGLRTLGYEDSVRDDPCKRRRPAVSVVPERSDPGMDGPPNIIEVDGGLDAPPSFASEDYVSDYGGVDLGDPEKPGYSYPDELSSPPADESGDEEDKAPLHGE